MNNSTADRRSPLGLFPGQARDHPRVPALVCDPPIGGRLRHPDGSRAARAQGHQNYDALHACVEPRRARGAQSPRPVAQGGLGREPGDYADQGVRIKFWSKLPNAVEIVTQQAVTARTRQWSFRVRPTGKGFMQVSLITS